MELDVFKENLTRKEILESARLKQKHAHTLKKYKINIHTICTIYLYKVRFGPTPFGQPTPAEREILHDSDCTLSQ